MSDIDAMLKERLCEFTSEGDDCEERGCGPIPDGQPVYFFSDGGYDCREGTYRCEKHARELLAGNQAAALAATTI